MSWTASVPPTAPSQFSEAVRECPVSPAEGELGNEPKAQLDAAREAAIELGALLGEDAGDKLIRASLSGHACTEGQEGCDSIQIQVSQQEPPQAEQAQTAESATTA